MKTKEILQNELKRLFKNYAYIDEGLDWLRLGTDENLRIVYELEKYKFSFLLKKKT